MIAWHFLSCSSEQNPPLNMSSKNRLQAAVAISKTVNAMTVIVFVHVILVVKPEMPARPFARSDVCGFPANGADSL